jgi:hypothetical protein
MDWMDPRIYGRITTEKPPIIPVPLDVINEVKAARLAGKQDLEIVDLLEARGYTAMGWRANLWYWWVRLISGWASLWLYRRLGDRHRQGQALTNLARALAEVCRFDQAIITLHQAVGIFHELGDRQCQGQVGVFPILLTPV